MTHGIPIPVVSIVGKSGCGKTTLIEKLIPELKKHHLRVATIKHHAHAGFKIDIPGKDTWRHAKAGSNLVVIAAPDKIATIKKTERELTLDELIHEIVEPNQIDIVLTEGFLRAGKPSIEVVRKSHGAEIICPRNQLIAIATDTNLNNDYPQYNLNNIKEIANFLINRFNLD